MSKVTNACSESAGFSTRHKPATAPAEPAEPAELELTHMAKCGVFGAHQVGFPRNTDSPREAVRLITTSLPPPFRKHLNPHP